MLVQTINTNEASREEEDDDDLEPPITVPRHVDPISDLLGR